MRRVLNTTWDLGGFLRRLFIDDGERLRGDIDTCLYIYAFMYDGQVALVSSYDKREKEISFRTLKGICVNYYDIRTVLRYTEIFEFNSQIEFLAWATEAVK